MKFYPVTSGPSITPQWEAQAKEFMQSIHKTQMNIINERQKVILKDLLTEESANSIDGITDRVREPQTLE